MPAWIPAALTLLLPAAMWGVATWFFVVGNQQGLIPALALIAGAPLGVGLGYLLAGMPWRGLAATLGFYVLMVGLSVTIGFLPTEFEDAGTLIAGAAIVAAVLLVAAAGACAWDVWRALAAKAAGGA